MTSRLPPQPDIRKPAALIACACLLQALESMIPSPIPGVRLGLANVVTVVALVDLGARAALEVAALRTLLASLILGTFLSPTFMLSFSGAMTSTLAMAMAYRLGSLGNRRFFSLVGISLVGAVVHNATQLVLAYGLLVRHPGIFLLAPWLGLSAVAMGWITGLVAMRACRHLGGSASRSSALQASPPLEGRAPASPRAIQASPTLEGRAPASPLAPPLTTEFEPGDSPLHRLPAATKILAMLGIAVVILCQRDMTAFAGILVALCILAAVGKVFSPRWFASVFKMRAFLLFSFLAPLLLTPAGDVWLQAGPLVITREGVTAGARIAWRLALLMLTTSLLVRTTAPAALAEGLRAVMRPLRWLRLPTDRLAATLSEAWVLIPALWDKCQSILRDRREHGASWKQVLPRLGNALASLYDAPGIQESPR